jgi:hypothetical protein
MLLVPLASAVEAVHNTDGSWSTTTVWPVSLERIRAQIADPIAAARFAPDIDTVTSLPAGRCPRYRVTTKSLVPVTYDMERCPTASGWHDSLVASDGLSIYQVDWSFSPESAGTRVRYSIHVMPSFPFPSLIIDQVTHDNVTGMFDRIEAALFG